MNFLFFLIKRLFISKKSSAVFRITNLITILSLSLGIASLNIVSSSIAGFESAIAQKLSDLNGYSTINHLFEDEFDSSEYKNLIPDGGIQYLEKYALLKSKKNSQNIVLNGYKSTDIDKINLFKNGNIELKKNHIIISKTLANKLSVLPGDELAIFNPANLNKFSNNNRFVFLKIKYLYDSGIEEYDLRQVFINLEFLQEFYNVDNKISGWILTNSNNQNAMDYPFYEINVFDRYANLFDWINTQKWPIFFIFSMIAIVSFFGLLSSLTVLFNEKKFNFSILSIYGLPNSSISKIFVFQSIMLAFLGSSLGIIISYLFIFFQNKFHFIAISQNIYFVDYLPMDFNYLSSLYLILFSILFSAVFSFASVKNFIKINPIDILRNK
ncbi:MAG: FtsX-like permease family protein [Candidatus Marinimicrobia bacterium]|nr:FtsX-like permease family protein [Candidatus Neomarinimicrobiota bacterium]